MAWNYSSDIGLLKSVIVHTPSCEMFKVITLAPADNPAMPSDYMGVGAQKEHEAFIEILKQFNIHVFQFADLLKRAIDSVYANGNWYEWLESVFGSSLFKKLDLKTITAEDLMGKSDRSFYNIDPLTGRLSPIFYPQKWMVFCRDFAANTPKGLILCNFANRNRSLEPYLARLVFEYGISPFSDIPLVFDAPKEGVYIQGGDIIVLEKDTLLLGVNNLTERKAAHLLAQRLDMRVIAVNLPPAISISRDVYQHFTDANLLFLHLDSVFTLVDVDKFVVVPYWFEKHPEESDLLADILLGLMPDGVQQKRVIAQLAEIGWITVYHPKTGKEEFPQMKLVDFLKSEGYHPIYVGGDKNINDTYKYVIERVLPELRFQSANLFTLMPGEVISYEGNQRYTLSALHEQGVITHTFESHELVRSNGGPRCMTLPIERN